MSKLRLFRLATAAEILLGCGGRLGPLETKVLELVWDQTQPLTVRQVQRAFPKLAYTTMMTTLDRLFRKRLLNRSRHGRGYAYEPRYSAAEALHDFLSDQVTNLLLESDSATTVLSTFVRAVGRRDIALLDELDGLVQAESTRLRMEEK